MPVKDEEYGGVETGPIRPPSEAASLYVRVSRNCPWNRCRFCPVYKGQRFSQRPLDHVLRDIDLLAAAGGRTVFLQDANALGTPYEDLLKILTHLNKRLPQVERVTSYARTPSILKLSVEQLAELKAAGLGRIHVGFESGSDEVLAFMHKGATKAMHVEAGLRVKEAGIELSAYYMPGLGGRRLLRENAIETADVVRQVEPDWLRLRTLAIPERAPLSEDASAGLFEKAGDVETCREILLFLEHVGDVPCRLVSDHVVNLIQELNGDLATDREAMIAVVRRFLEMEPGSQRTYMVGRRLGVFARLDDMDVPSLRSCAEAECRRLGVTEGNVDALVDRLVKRFV